MSMVVEDRLKNRLINHIEFWKNCLSPSELVMSTIEYGYIIPFYQDPPSAFLKNNKSALNHADFVVAAITGLEEKGCTIKVFRKPYVINPLTVSVNDSGKHRLVLDLRHVKYGST